MSTERHPDPSTRTRPRRGALVALATVLALVGGACATPSPPASGGVEIEFGPLTVPLPPIEVRAPATTIPLGICSISYRPPGVRVVGATVIVPRVRIDPAVGRITVPNVTVRIPQLRIPLSTITLTCGLLSVPVQIDLIIPSTVNVQAATVDLNARTITLSNPSFTINGAGLGINGLDLVLPLPPLVTVPLPTAAIAF